MPVTDPIADMLTRIRNATLMRHDSVPVPASKLKLEIARILGQEGFIRAYEVMHGTGVQRTIRIHLQYGAEHEPYIRGLRRASKPGLRRYVGAKAVPRHYQGLGISVVSTPQGLMTGYEARRRGIGGELLCYVW